ncbi:Undecaprenyl-diphosphatase [hydrothermal vent metagenome]|uniref:Undecaprenyl-diphosphatase n=1 Tax=hydrothermal vent metagenome TaxID=652676 RepID=A0A3B0U7N2_9ZZZZ
MPIEQLLTLAIVQGLTEFLPVSSSGHLNLVHLLTRWEDQGPLMDVAVHVGSLFAVMVYFWRDMLMLLSGLGNLVRGKMTPEGRLFLYLIVASLPVLAVGFVMVETGMLTDLRTLAVIAWANLGFAVLLWAGDAMGLTIRRLDHTSFFDAALIGLAQVFSLIPGASRAGVTMTMARFLGYERPDAARISMLLSIPTILALGLGTGYKLQASGDLALQEGAFIAAGLSGIAALLSIWVMMALMRRTTMFVFVAYRFVLGAVLLAVVYDYIPLGQGG